jgi:hypothetical protein
LCEIYRIKGTVVPFESHTKKGKVKGKPWFSFSYDSIMLGTKKSLGRMMMGSKMPLGKMMFGSKAPLMDKVYSVKMGASPDVEKKQSSGLERRVLKR